MKKQKVWIVVGKNGSLWALFFDQEAARSESLRINEKGLFGIPYRVYPAVVTWKETK